jgi:hypothetical protein
VPTSAIVESSPDGRSFLERFRYTRMVGGEDYKMRAIDPASLPSPPIGKHRFWGISTSAVQSGAANGPFGVAEIELRATVGGAAINTGGAGAGAKEPFASLSFNPSQAFDGNTSTEYASNGSALPDILAYDFGIGNEKSPPAQLKIRARDATSSNFNQSPVTFDLVYSDDGQNWTVQQSYTSPSTWAASEERLFSVTLPASRRREIINC